MGGDEFVVMIADASESDLASVQSRLQSNIDMYNLKAAQGQTFSFSLGVIRVEPESTITMEELLAQADAAMYKHKLSRRRTA
jgi:diguanylate cyclase (GGDEF)-like protein